MRTTTVVLALMLTGTLAALAAPQAAALPCGALEIECHQRTAEETAIAAQSLVAREVAHTIDEIGCVLGESDPWAQVRCVDPLP